MPTQTYIRAFVYKVVLGAGAWRYVPGFIWKYSVSSLGQMFPDSIPILWTTIVGKHYSLGILQTGNNTQGGPAVPSLNPNELQSE